MDPFIEDQEWDDFHLSWNVTVCELLGPVLAPRYVARIDRPAAELARPRQSRVLIREVPSLEIVTIIETLSPARKYESSDRREQYLQQREEVLQRGINLVELDLLRGGKRLPGVSMTSSDYCAIVNRGHPQTQADPYSWTVRQPMPTIRVPLKREEVDVPLNLQQVFTTVYARARYDLSINYAARLSVALLNDHQRWFETLSIPPSPERRKTRRTD